MIELKGEVMEGTVLAAIITGAVALVVVSVTPPITYYFNKKHDHEADWRKKKLEHYIEFISAFSRGSGQNCDVAEQQQFTDAVNSLELVAPPEVLIAFKIFWDGTQDDDIGHDPHKWRPLWSSFMRVMRKDCHPKPPKDNPEFIFEPIFRPPNRTN